MITGLLIPFIGTSAGAAGVFYYFKTDDVKRLFAEMAGRFPGAVLAFDSRNERGAKLMRKSRLKDISWSIWMVRIDK